MAEFDATAQGYDAEFTHTQTGKYQRFQVWKQLHGVMLAQQKVLEMNCGTGEDALFFAKEKAIVTATDISQEMLNVAKEKAKYFENEGINFVKWDLSQDFPLPINEKFDIAFSNFGGWNCLSAGEIEKLGKNLYELLAENGQLFVVIMPSFCVWESMYFLLKGDIKKAFRRRNRLGVSARLNDNQYVRTFYFSPRKMKELLSSYFLVEKTRPIGFFLPPSYLDNALKKMPFLLSFLFLAEKCVSFMPFLAYFSDHYVMVLRRK